LLLRQFITKAKLSPIAAAQLPAWVPPLPWNDSWVSGWSKVFSKIWPDYLYLVKVELPYSLHLIYPHLGGESLIDSLSVNQLKWWFTSCFGYYVVIF